MFNSKMVCGVLWGVMLWVAGGVMGVAAGQVAAPTTRPVVSFVLRVDDLFNRGHAARPRSISGFLDLAEKYGYKATLNTIPRRLIESPNEGGAMVRELQEAVRRGHEITQHGYDHCCSQCGDTGHDTYCNLLGREQSVEEEIKDIQRGKEMLEAAIGRRIFVYGPTGVDLSTVQLITVVKGLGFAGITGEEREDHRRIGLPVVPTGEDYSFGAKTEAEFAEALVQVKAEFDEVVKRAKLTGKPGYFQFLLHDPFVRTGYEGGAGLRYVEAMLVYMEGRKNEVEIRNVVSSDVLGLTADELKLPEPKYPTLFKDAKELNRMKGELLTTQPSR